jgi:hypothetical protein
VASTGSPPLRQAATTLAAIASLENNQSYKIYFRNTNDFSVSFAIYKKHFLCNNAIYKKHFYIFAFDII